MCVGSDPTPPPRSEAQLQTQGRYSHTGLITPAHGARCAPAARFIAGAPCAREPGFRRTKQGADSTRWLWVTSMFCILRTDQVRVWPHLWPLPSKATGSSGTGTEPGCRSYRVGAFPAPAPPSPPWGPCSKWVRAPHTPLTRPEHQNQHKGTLPCCICPHTRHTPGSPAGSPL